MKIKGLVAWIIIVVCLAALIVSGCTLQEETDMTLGDHPEYVKTKTTPSGYLQVSVSPGGVSVNIGEHVDVRCSVVSLIDTPVDITSISLALFNSHDSLIRKKPMTLDTHWSASTTYTIVGDEAYYRLLVDFTINPLRPEYFSEYTSESFPIVINP